LVTTGVELLLTPWWLSWMLKKSSRTTAAMIVRRPAAMLAQDGNSLVSALTFCMKTSSSESPLLSRLGELAGQTLSTLGESRIGRIAYVPT